MKLKKKSVAKKNIKVASKKKISRKVVKSLGAKKQIKPKKKIDKKKTKPSIKKYFRRKDDTYFKKNTSGPNFSFNLEVKFNESSKIPYRRKSDLLRCEKLDDNDLVRIVLGENPEVYRILFKRYEKSLYIYIYHMVRNKEEVEDLLQNVFTKTFKSLARYDLERKFSSWIYRIAHNESVNYIKRSSKRRLVSWEDVTTSKDKLVISVEAENVADMLMHKEFSKEVDEALKEVSGKYRQILTLRYFKEYSYQQIGDILDKPVNTVGTLINRAKKKLFEVVTAKRNEH